MEIFNGPYRTVRYFSQDQSASEQNTLRDLARAENEASVADQWLALREQYLRNERALENQRHAVNRIYYGYSTTEATALTPFSPAPSFPGLAPFGVGLAGGVSTGFPLAGVFSPGSPGVGSSGLEHDIGSEGVLKRELAKVIASQVTPEHLAKVYRKRDNALARVAPSASPRNGVRLASFESTEEAPDIITLKDGSRLAGTVVREENDWLHLDTGVQKVRIRKDEVARIAQAKRSDKAAEQPSEK